MQALGEVRWDCTWRKHSVQYRLSRFVYLQCQSEQHIESVCVYPNKLAGETQTNVRFKSMNIPSTHRPCFGGCRFSCGGLTSTCICSEIIVPVSRDTSTWMPLLGAQKWRTHPNLLMNTLWVSGVQSSFKMLPYPQESKIRKKKHANVPFISAPTFAPSSSLTKI